ncbi:mitochondrial membrane protein [Dimargaris cristalligena]|nr:mitochondrial membrane protein [Dimargaris cristalligena]
MAPNATFSTTVPAASPSASSNANPAPPSVAGNQRAPVSATRPGPPGLMPPTNPFNSADALAYLKAGWDAEHIRAQSAIADAPGPEKPSNPPNMSAPSTLPLAVDAETPLSRPELDVLRRQFDRESPNVTVQTKFNYAWGLVKSNYRKDQEKGITLLLEVHQEAPNRQRECLYYIALGFYKLGNYAEARRFNQALLAYEPKNEQALSLGELIDKKVSKDGILGLALLGASVAVGAILVGFLRRK